MRIVWNGHPALRQKAEAIGGIHAEVLSLGETLTASLLRSPQAGVGLAAPQIGISRRMVVIDTRPSPDAERPLPLTTGEVALEPLMPVVLVNPEIVSKSAATETCSEGCLSLPGISAKVERPAEVVLRARLLDGQEILLSCGNLLGRCLQHEIDHLDGVLFIDHASKEEQEAAAPQMKKLAKEEHRRYEKQKHQG